MDKQQLRNALSAVEDDARRLRMFTESVRETDILTLIARLSQLVREEIVK